MTYNQLFKLTDFLNGFQAVTTFIELTEETSFKEAFGELNAFVDDTKVKGLYIVVFPEDTEDRECIINGIKNYCKDIELTSTIVSGINRDGFDMIVIEADETN